MTELAYICYTISVFFIFITMFSPQLRYFLYGSLLSASLISLSASAGTADGVFGDYFTRIIGGCPANTVVTGFDSTASTYGTRQCSSLQLLLGTLFGSSTAPDWQAMIGFNPDGTIKYGTIAGWDGWSFWFWYGTFNNQFCYLWDCQPNPKTGWYYCPSGYSPIGGLTWQAFRYSQWDETFFHYNCISN